MLKKNPKNPNEYHLLEFKAPTSTYKLICESHAGSKKNHAID